MTWLIELGYPLWLALLLEDAGAPPNYAGVPLGDVGRIAIRWTVRW